MSLTITEAATIMQSPYRPVFLDVSSDDVNIVSVIADIYVNGVLKTTLDKAPKLGSTNEFRMEVSDVLKKNLTSELRTNITTNSFTSATVSACEWYVRLFEVTEVGGVRTTGWDENGAGIGYLQSATVTSFNGVNQHNQILSDYQLGLSSSKLLTNRPSRTKILNSIPFQLGGLVSSSDVRAYFQYYNNGSTNGAYQSGVIEPTYDKIIIEVYPDDFTSNTDRLDLHVEYYDFPTQKDISETLRFDIVESCGDETVIFWQNHWGAFDYYFFSGNRKQSTKNKKQTSIDRLDLDYNSYDRGVRVLTNKNTRTFKVYTQTEKPSVVEWLAEIGESVDVYIYENSEFIPIVVKSVESEIENTENIKTQISVTYELANKRISQLG